MGGGGGRHETEMKGAVQKGSCGAGMQQRMTVFFFFLRNG